MIFNPDPERVRRYEPARRPYVEVREGDSKYHALVAGWNGEMILIKYQPRFASGTYEGEPESKWVPTAAATRIRRADSIWASTEDDHDWHAEQDKRIEYRADPWTVYSQEVPGE